MPFLSLGLLKDEREEVARENAALGEGSRTVSSRQDGSLPADTQAGENGTPKSRALPNAGLSSFDPVSDRRAGEGTHRYMNLDDGLSDKNVRPTQDQDSQLPAAIEELRLKVSGNELPQATVWGEKKGISPTEYLTV